MANDIKLQEEHPVDENLRPLKVGGKQTAIELAQRGDGMRINGDLEIVGTDNVIIKSADVKIDSEKKLYLDGGGDTYLTEVDDKVTLVAGGDSIVEFIEDGNTGNYLNLSTSCAGFLQGTATYVEANTNVSFQILGHKVFCTFGSGNITDMNLIFPNISGSFILLLKQDGTGSRTVTNWKTFDQSLGNESTVVWSGGSNPTLTTTADKLDILSFYWDNTNHKAYGVASLNF